MGTTVKQDSQKALSASEKKKKYANFEFERIPIRGFEQVVKITNTETKLLAIVAIHSTILGPAIGGTRMLPYENFEEALTDVLRLAKGMTYKAAVSGVGLGGAKSVIIADPKTEKSEELLESFGVAMNYFEGRYVCAEDMGTCVDDAKVINRQTPYIVGLPHEKSSGDPSPFTAWGVYRGIQASLNHVFKNPSVKGKTIAVQGLGKVGSVLIDYLFWAGAKLVISDINETHAKELGKKYGATVVTPEKIFDVECDVFCPCARGGILNEEILPRLKTKIVAGAANNQLIYQKIGSELKNRNILYAPDFVINAGGLINVTEEVSEKGYNPANAQDKTHNIYDCLASIYEIADKNNTSTNAAAVSLAEYRMKYGIHRRIEPLVFHHSK